MKKKKYGGITVVAAIVLAELLSFQFFVNLQVRSINEAFLKNPSAAGGMKKTFHRFDATQFVDHPFWLGEKVSILYENQLLETQVALKGTNQEARIKHILGTFAGKERLIIAFQNWPIMDDDKENPSARTHVRWYLHLLFLARQVLPQTNIGFVFPMRDLVHDGLALLAPVIKASDAFYPAFEVAEHDFEKSLRTMADAIMVARSFLKPVYPVIRFQSLTETDQGKKLPDAIIEKQCQFVREHAEGLVWWSAAGEKLDELARKPAAEACFR